MSRCEPRHDPSCTPPGPKERPRKLSRSRPISTLAEKGYYPQERVIERVISRHRCRIPFSPPWACASTRLRQSLTSLLSLPLVCPNQEKETLGKVVLTHRPTPFADERPIPLSELRLVRRMIVPPI